MGAELPVGLSDAQAISGTKGIGHVIAELEEVRSDRVVDRLQERFDQITARCMDSDGAAPVTLAICSANAREGTTTVSVGMASAAQRLLGRDVVLVETNTIAPMLATEFHVSRFPGLSEYLSGESDLEQVVRRTRQNGLWLVSAGGKVDTPGPLIRSDRFPADPRCVATDLQCDHPGCAAAAELSARRADRPSGRWRRAGIPRWPHACQGHRTGCARRRRRRAARPGAEPDAPLAPALAERNRRLPRLERRVARPSQ